MAEAEELLLQTAIATNYRQWKFCHQLLMLLRRRVLAASAEARVEKISSVFGRWLQSIQHLDRGQLDERYPLFPRSGEPLMSRESTRELLRFLTGVLRVTDDRAEPIVTEIQGQVEEFLATHAEDHQEIAVRFKNALDGNPARGGQIIVEEFRSPREPRVSCFVNNFGEINTALVCLRYAPLAEFKGGESGMSVTALNALHDIGQARYEGFSSPLNCRLLGRPDVQFCSLFKDTDSAFGSLGNFFDINLADYPGGWILNPPFVELVLEETARKVVQFLNETETKASWFFVTFPNWEDNDGWLALNESAFKVARIDFQERLFLQQDLYGKTYRPNIPLQMFVLGKLPDTVDLLVLRNRLSDGDDEDRVRRDWLEACDIEA